jgi:predicted GNAT superfamily acetyltransferase
MFLPRLPHNLEIRSLQTLDEYRECVALQIETWDCPEECVPPAVLKVSQMLGGVAAGAFDETGRLLGFVFGLTGWRGGELCHWSDMLAVKREFRDLGLGRRLKQFQRAQLLEQQVNTMYWTFDPLVARNAYLNLEKLGAHVTEYVPDMYGSGDSSMLDSVIGTDRFIVRWRLDVEVGSHASDNDDGPGRDAPFPEDSAIVNRPPGGKALGTPRPDHGQPAAPVYIEIPSDIETLKVTDVNSAVGWRESTRKAFRSHLGQGYEVARFLRSPTSDRCVYVLVPQASRAAGAGQEE